MNNLDSGRQFCDISYDTKKRFCSFWHQINEIVLLQPELTVEIGTGNKFVSNYLKNKGLTVFSIDILPSLKPDIAGSVLAMPFPAESADAILCCEVLEHLPYDSFVSALRELHRITKKNVILSLPDVSTVYRINIELPKIKPIRKLIPHPFHRAPEHVFDGEHYWEIGKAGYPLKRIQSDIGKSGFDITTTYRVFENYYHRFFVLEKKRAGCNQ
jgi:predicted SAM-dependent methyltransferase